MRVVYLIAGAGGMYCGSCLRDNRLVATWLRQGRDVVLIPLYTPIRTDEMDVSERAVSYGGISVYLEQQSKLFRRMPRALDRLLSARSLLRLAGRRAGATRANELGDMTVSVLEGSHGHQRRELELLIERLRPLQPALVHLPNLLLLGAAKDLRAALSCRVACSLAGEDIFLDALPEPHRTQALDLIRKSAAEVDLFVAPTNYYAGFVCRTYGIDASLIRYAPLGIDTDGTAGPADPAPQPFTIGYLARICPEKGFHVLCDAFKRLRQSGKTCRLRVAGYLGRADRVYYNDTVAGLARAGMTRDFEYLGEVSRAQKVEFLGSLHVLSVPTVYHEAKGLYVLEAMACGVPVVQPGHGSFPELIEATGGGLVYDPNDAGGLVNALVELMEDDDLRRRLAAAGRRAVRERFTDEVMARETWSLYEQCIGA